jgi:hypothetical protein
MILEKPDFTHPLLRKGWGTHFTHASKICLWGHPANSGKIRRLVSSFAGPQWPMVTRIGALQLTNHYISR